MTKFNEAETRALYLLAKNGPLIPGRDRFAVWKSVGFIKALDSLARKGRVEREDTDDGPRYSLTALGEADAT